MIRGRRENIRTSYYIILQSFDDGAKFKFYIMISAAITNTDDQLSGVIMLKKYHLSCFYLFSAALKYALSRSAANIIPLNTNVISFFFFLFLVELKELWFFRRYSE